MFQQINSFFVIHNFLGIALANWIVATSLAMISFILARAAIGFFRRKRRTVSVLPNAHISHDTSLGGRTDRHGERRNDRKYHTKL